MNGAFPWRVLLVAAIATGLPVACQAQAALGSVDFSQIKTVFVISMENHNFTQPATDPYPQPVLGNVAAPYINSLITPGNPNAAQVAYAAKYYCAGTGVHPSEPNYIWAEAATDFGIVSDDDPSLANGNLFTVPHLTGQLNAAGIPWKNYQENVSLSTGPQFSAAGFSATNINPYYHTGAYDYAVKHNPMAFFTDTQTQNVYELAVLFTDLASNQVGRYNWISPNQYNAAHSALGGGFTYHGSLFTGDQGAIAQGDNFLSLVVPQIMASTAYQDHGLIIIWWDEVEGEDSTDFTIPEIIISPLAKGKCLCQ